MKKAILAASFLIVGLAPQMAAADARSDSAPIRLTVSVFNDAEASPSVMSQALSRATLILRRAGITLIWLDCGTPGHPPPNSSCSDLSYPRHLSVRVVSAANRGTVSEDTFGQTFQNAAGEGNYALVYFQTLASSNVNEAVHIGDLIGFVIAHEIGHLLLGRESHSATGLMSAVWQANEMRLASQGILFFTSNQQQRIRSRCLAAQSAREKAASMSLTASGK